MGKYYGKNVSILITGEAGTGKSTLARRIHEKSYNAHHSFVTVHLTTLKESLIESELFGHKKGSFSGAIKDRSGYCKTVGKGTLFLDEIGDLSLSMQKKLLFLLEEKRFIPVGSCHEEKFEGRFIFATNKDLEALVAKGEFREDLFYRISVIEMFQKPIRSNKKIIKERIENFLNQVGDLSISESCKELLLNYAWPGNFRELNHCLLAASLLARDNYIEIDNLPRRIRSNTKFKGLEQLENTGWNYHRLLEDFDKRFLSMALKEFKGGVNRTAREIGISKTTLIAKMRKYGMTGQI